MSKLVRCITTDGLVMAAAMDSTDIVRKAHELHRTTPVITSALGRLLTGASIMGNKLKEDNASLTLRMNGGGPAGSIIAVSDSKGNVRGYAQEAGLMLRPNAKGQLDVSGAIGKEGTVTVIKDYGYGQPYCTQTPIVTGEVAEDLTAYYAISEQVPTVFCIGVHFDEKWRLDKAGGLLIQLMPAADHLEIEKIEEMLRTMPPVTRMLLEGNTPEQMRLFARAGGERVHDHAPRRDTRSSRRQRQGGGAVPLLQQEILRHPRASGRACLAAGAAHEGIRRR